MRILKKTTITIKIKAKNQIKLSIKLLRDSRIRNMKKKHEKTLIVLNKM